ncbi:MAG: type I restriction-modification system subunit M N-terminal domain-containing protein [Spirochaetaceae bacterium]|nr:type I restriction-modification system subunit M N-terminal domain-containing protein [Spirochaetaceae bacterium]
MSNGDLNWIANYVWGIADDVLRDLYVRGKYRDVILPMTVLRRLDAVLEGSKQAVLDMKAALDNAGVVEQDAALRQAAGQAFYNTSRFTLSDLRARANRQQLTADFRAYLDGFSPSVQDILDNLEFRNQIPRLSRADALGTLIKKLTSPDTNLSPARADPPDGYGGVGWSGGNFHDYDREYGVDLVQLAAFLCGTQPEAAAALALSEDGPTRRAFLTRLQGEIAKRGTIDVLRNGGKHGALNLDLFYGTPSAHNLKARERFEQNRFTATPQLSYSGDDVKRALDIGLFINGLPVFPFELKNSLTKQTIDDAFLQYQRISSRARSCSSSGAATTSSTWCAGCGCCRSAIWTRGQPPN